MPHGKYGYVPRDFSKPAPEFGRYVLAADPLPDSPAFADRESKVTSWPMYKNDQLGDCTVAGMLHAISSMTAYSGQVPGGAMFTDEEAVKIYSAVSGYDPVSGANDNGAQLADVCKYMVQTGATDVNGKVHKLAAWAEITSFANLRLLKRVANAFGSVYLAINCPYSALDQFDAGKPWTVDPSSQIDGGHAICLQYSAVNTGTMDDETIITWGKEQKMNEAFARTYLAEAVALVSADDVNVQTGKNPVGLDLQTLVNDCQTQYLT